jgi:hypothetical protein
MAGVSATVLDGAVEVRVLSSYTGPGLTASQWTAGVDITEDLLGDGLSRSVTENAITIDRLSSKQVGEKPGTTQEEVELTYAWAPQGSGSSAYTVLAPGADKALAIRYGVAHGTAAAAAQKVDIIKITTGAQRRVAVARNEESRVTQKMFVEPGGTQLDVSITSP